LITETILSGLLGLIFGAMMTYFYLAEEHFQLQEKSKKDEEEILRLHKLLFECTAWNNYFKYKEEVKE